MPAKDGSARKSAHREWRSVHEALVGACDPKLRKVPFDARTVIHERVRIRRTIGVVVHEFMQPQIVEQSGLPGVLEVTREHPFRRAWPQYPRLRQRERR